RVPRDAGEQGLAQGRRAVGGTRAQDGLETLEAESLLGGIESLDETVRVEDHEVSRLELEFLLRERTAREEPRRPRRRRQSVAPCGRDPIRWKLPGVGEESPAAGGVVLERREGH